MEKFILALDQGTTSSRTLLIDSKGKIIDTAQKEFTQIFPQPGWVEHDANEIWQSQLETINNIFSNNAQASEQIGVVGITNQRETTILWNRETSEPIHNAIVWQDRRTSAYCTELAKTDWKEKIHQKTGLLIDAYFSATKLKWLLDNVDGARTLALEGKLCFGTVDSWLIYKLTNGTVHATDVSNASRTMLFNIQDMAWDEELLELFDIPRSILPEVKSSKDDYGITEASVLGKEIPIGSAIGDQQSALFGQTCFSKGMMKNTYGTGCFLVLNTGNEIKYSNHKLLSTVAWKIDGETTYAMEGSVFVGGAIVQWLRDGLSIIDSSSEIESLCTSVEDNGGVYFVPALTGLGAPHWDSEARGTLFGLTRGTERGHIARAAVESIAFQVNDLVSAMNSDLGEPISALRVDGGASANNYLMQFQSDLINAKVERPVNLETTAMGAAFLAGLSQGIWNSLEELKSLSTLGSEFSPSTNREKVESEIKFWNKAISRSLEWLKD